MFVNMLETNSNSISEVPQRPNYYNYNNYWSRLFA